VAYRSVPRQAPRNKETTAVARQWIGKHAFTTVELLLETVFLCGPCRGVILKTIWATQLVVS
jgi:hypothetical protein